MVTGNAHVEYRYGENEWGTLLDVMPATEHRKEILFRLAGDDSIMVEYGREMELDYMDMFRIQAVNQEVMMRQVVGYSCMEGFLQALPQWRTIQYTFDTRRVSIAKIVEIAKDIERAVGDSRNISQMVFNSKIIELPLCWEHDAIKVAIGKYLKEIRPEGAANIDREKLSNVPYIAQCNGISPEEVKEKIYGTDWFAYTMCFLIGLIMCVPFDRKCMMFTNKYNPPRTWTARSTWGMGGFDVGWYAAAGAGGYQLFGVFSPVLQMEQKHPDFQADVALFHTLDRVRPIEVDSDELARITQLIDDGSPEFRYKVIPGEFSVAEWLEHEREHKGEIQKWLKHAREAFQGAPIP